MADIADSSFKVPAFVAIVRRVALRTVSAVPTLALIIVASFVLLKIAPGDLADTMAGDSGAASPEIMETLRRQYGLDQPVLAQFGNYLSRLARLDLGYSYRNGMPVLDLILQRLPATALLTLTSIAIALAVGITAGVIAAYHRGRWPDAFLSIGSTVGFATPLFWVGLMFIFIFAVELRWFPTGGMRTAAFSGGALAQALDVARHLVLPAVTLSLFFVSIYARVIRASVIEVLNAEYVRTAEAKGLARSRIVIRHVLRNALIPIVSITGFELGTLLSGTITLETVFAWPGMGRLAYEAVTYRDVNLLMGVLIFSAVAVIAVNILLDVVYVAIDPRIVVK